MDGDIERWIDRWLNRYGAAGLFGKDGRMHSPSRLVLMCPVGQDSVLGSLGRAYVAVRLGTKHNLTCHLFNNLIK